MRFLTVLITFVVFLTLFSQCRRQSTEPQPAGPDTTSHDFVWRMDTIGWRNTELFDVSIIDENNIWVSGYITKEGTDTVYSAAHWTGKEWNLERFKTDNTVYDEYLYNPYGVHALSNNDIWIASGSIYHWDGQLARLSWQRDIWTTTIAQHLWYHNDHDIWASGSNGLILHYDGQEWHELESGTTTSVIDIWGHVNSKDGSQLVLATISYDWWSTEGDYKIVSLHNNRVVDTLQWKWPHERPLMSLWWDKDTPLYVVGAGLALYDSAWHTVNDVSNYGMYKIRGSGWNNIFVVGSYGMIVHYNGADWHTYWEIMNDGNLKSVAVKDNLIVAVGSLGSYRPYGIAIIGKRKR